MLIAGCQPYHGTLDKGVEEAKTSESLVANDPRGVWLARRPSQCSDSDPWRKDWIETYDNKKYPQGVEELSNILRFCSKRGVQVIDSSIRYEPITACAACSCAGSHIAFLLVSEADAPTVAAFGFRPQRP